MQFYPVQADARHVAVNIYDETVFRVARGYDGNGAAQDILRSAGVAAIVNLPAWSGRVAPGFQQVCQVSRRRIGILSSPAPAPGQPAGAGDFNISATTVSGVRILMRYHADELVLQAFCPFPLVMSSP